MYRQKLVVLDMRVVCTLVQYIKFSIQYFIGEWREGRGNQEEWEERKKKVGKYLCIIDINRQYIMKMTLA